MAKNYSDSSEAWEQRDYEDFLDSLAKNSSSATDEMPEVPVTPQQAPRVPSSPVAAAPENPEPDANPDVAAFIKYKQLLGDDNKALEAARQESRDRMRDTNFAQAFGDLGAGLAGQKVDPSFYNSIKDQEATKVKGAESDVERNRKLVQDYMNNERAIQVSRDNREARKQTSEDNAKLRSQLFQDNQDRKNSTRQDSAYQKLRHDLETFRGNTAVQTAAQGVLSANKAIDMVAGKDPNTLTTQDLRVLMEEISKIASGGIPGEHGVAALMPNNLQTKFAELKNFYLSKPTDAQAAEYIKHNMDYLQKMKDTSQAVVNDYRRNILKGAKHTVRPEDLEETVNDYHLNEAAPQTDRSTTSKPAWAK